MPAPILDAFIERMPIVRAQHMLDVAEAVAFGAGASHGGADAYQSWRRTLEQVVRGDSVGSVRQDGTFESFASIKRRREAERDARLAQERAQA